MTKRITIALLLALPLLALAPRAEARKVTAQDKELVRDAMKYMGAIAGIVSKAVEKPDAGLDELEVYIKKNKAAIHALAAKLERLEGELDPDAKQELEQYVQSQPETKKLMEAMMAFFQKHQQDEAKMKRITGLLQQLEPPAAKGKDGSKTPDKKKSKSK